MRKLQADVAKFHLKFGVPVNPTPVLLSTERRNLRKSLIKEESRELRDAITINDLPKIADGVADLIYVALGAACEYGIDMAPIWNEVQRTNMLKEGGATRADGKILKPDGWKEPEIHRLVSEQFVGESLLKKLARDRDGFFDLEIKEKHDPRFCRQCAENR